MENNNHNSFEYTYSAPQQDEIKKIRQKYLPKEEDKMSQLIQLDKSVTQKGTVAALVVGVISTLLLGIGMCCTMVWTEKLFIIGIVIGVLGILGISLAYPLYTYIIKKERKKIAPEIIRLTDELMK